jgi:nicotinamide-nucleotide amidase
MPGSSEVYLGGVISYAYSAKEDLLGVKKSTLEKFGAVSEATVREMAEGCRSRLKSDFALALSGISGPGGGLPDKPVGTIHVALSSAQGTKSLHQVILASQGSRDQNRVIAAHFALDALRTELLGFHANRFPLSSNV